MKRILVYGINNRPILSRIGQWLSEAYQIIGYIDNQAFDKIRYFSCKPLYSIQMVINRQVDYDYILLASGVDDEIIKTKIISGGQRKTNFRVVNFK